MADINKVLIANDDTFMLLSLKTVPEKEGFSLIEAKDGQQAVTAFIEHHPDCVLLDGLMSNMDGFRPVTKYVYVQQVKPYLY